MCRSIQKNIDITKLRKALGTYPTGVSVVTAIGRDQKTVGMTINSLVSISLDPPLLGWCIDAAAASFADFSQCRRFSISVLSSRQAELARRFATRGADKFAGLEHCLALSEEGEEPLLIPGACAWIVCQPYRFIPLGDHLMLVGEVMRFQQGNEVPLVFARGQFSALEAEYEVA